MSVEFSATHLSILEDALKNLGYQSTRSGTQVSFYTRNGSVTIGKGRMNMEESDRYLIDKIKQEYSREIIKKAASRYGWAVKKKSNNQFEVTKR